MKKILSRMMMLATMMAAMTVFTSCEDDDDYIAQKLRDKDWQGYVGNYYQSRWGISGNQYSTVMRFWSKGSYYTSGKGEEIDYNTYSRYQDYAYCTFRWFIVDGDITLIYDDDIWSPLYITDYSLYSDRFRGYIQDVGSGRIAFDFYSNPEGSSWNSTYWDDYNYTGGYGDFNNQKWYRARTSRDDDEWQAVPQEDEDVLFLDRTEIARRQSGDSTAVSHASGEFARILSNR
ncbi:MAG: hypothetical protein IJT98_10390 [Prevotella sp.]|nr:hypothetical protein [Prevotella sp.]